MFIGCPHSRFHLHIQILHHLLPNIAPSQPPYCPPVAAPIAKSSGWCETAPPRFSVAEGPPGIEKPRFWQNMVKQWQHWKCRKHYGFSKKLLTIYQIDAILIYIINYNYIYMEVSWGYPNSSKNSGFDPPWLFRKPRPVQLPGLASEPGPYEIWEKIIPFISISLSLPSGNLT